MNDDLEPRLRNAFRHEPLPSAPASLFDALERVTSTPVVVRRRRSGPSVWAPLAVAAVLAIAGAVIVAGGQRGVTPPTTAVSQPPPAITTGMLRIEYEARPLDGVSPNSASLEVVRSIIEDRLTTSGVVGATVRAEGSDRVVVEVPAAADTQAIRDLIGQTGHIDFVPLGTTQMEAGDTIDPKQFPALFSGQELETAAIGSDQTGGRVVTFILKSNGAKLFGDYTAANVGKYFAIVLDSKVISAPVIQNAIPGGHVEITSGGVGGYPLDEAQNLVAVLQFGALPFPIVEISNEGVAPGSSPTAP